MAASERGDAKGSRYNGTTAGSTTPSEPKSFLRPFTSEDWKVNPVNIQGPFFSSALPHEVPPQQWTSRAAQQDFEKTSLRAGVTVAEVDLGSSDGANDGVGSPSQEEWERMKAWQDERLQSRLRGEYEDAQARLTSTYESHRRASARLDAIRVEGAVHTRPSFLRQIFRPCLEQDISVPTWERLLHTILPELPKAPKPDSLETILQSVEYLSTALAAHGIFSSIVPTLGPSWNSLSTSEDIALSLKVTEASRYLLKTSTDFGNGEGSARITGRLRNAFGGAETIEGEFGGGTRSSNNFQLRLETPILANHLARLEASVFGSTRNNQWYASHDEKLQGARLMYKALSGSTLHQVAYDLHLRKIFHLSPIVSTTIRRQAGDSIKSALSYTMINDQRNDRLLPTQGHLIKTTTELADLGGDASFLKMEAEGQLAMPLADRFHLTTTCQIGGLTGLRSGCQGITSSDRFRLGGSNSVRGFRTHAIGPRDRVDYVGGEAFWASGLSVYAPVPGVARTWDMRSHFFVNAGRLIQADWSKAGSAWQSLRQAPSISFGFGLVYRHPAARIEINMVMPLAASKSDGMRKGIEVGIGASFL